jgi:hypothetical protein
MLDFANLTRCVRFHPALSQLPESGLAGYLVGGFIRDALLDRNLGQPSWPKRSAANPSAWATGFALTASLYLTVRWM